ncbi:MAG: PP2C family protein-serine/threonine phosphatase [Planctomycetes bacterium]|nr:PP2C family protein-serine/threonine phosphatase [Planctomycetota bacterium]
MSDLMPLALDFARAFNKAVRSFRMYSPTHPQVAHDMQEAFGWLEKMTAVEATVAMGTRDGSMIIQGRPVREMTAGLKSFCDVISARGISSFSAQRGATLTEFAAFVDILVKKPEEVMKGDALNPEFLKPLHKIRINELRFVALEDGASEGAIQALSAGGTQQHELMSLLGAYVTAGTGDATQLSDGLTSLIQKGNAADLVTMMDDVVSQMDEAGISKEQRVQRMSQIFHSLPFTEEVQKLQRVIVMQFDAEGAESPPLAIEKLGDGTHWSGLVADAGFRGPEGVRFLDQVARTGKKPVPVVLLSWDEAVRESPAVTNYPNLRFISQPTDPPVITGAIDEIALPPHIDRLTQEQVTADPMVAGEMERARQIQAKLLPTSIPEVAGFEIAAQYIPAQTVGGDYYDVLALPGGRLGFIIADVSGKGISAAMIMVMARTVFHSVAPGAASAKEAVLEANARLTPDLPPGLFLTLAYAILDPATATVTIVSCGHNPPLLWARFDNSSIIQTVEVQGAAMGLVRGPAFERSLKESVVHLQPGEHLLMHTDGVNEAMDFASEEFGDKKLFRAMKRGGEKDATGMAQEVVNAVMHHRGEAPASDDITVLVVRRQP